MSPSDPQTKTGSGVRQGRRGLTQRLARVIQTILPRASHRAEGVAGPADMGLPDQRILSASAALYQRLANRMSAMAFELAPDGAILFVDQTITAITGYGPDELLGRPWWDILFPGEQARQIAELLKRLRSGDVTGYDLVLTHKTGMLVTLGLNTANDYDLDGTLQTIVGWAVDRTQHRRAEAKARAVADTLGERVKELTVLHGAMRILQNEDKPIPDLLNEVLAILPRACRYPDVAVARIVWDDQTYATPDFTSTPWMQRAKLTTADGKHGAIEIGYLQYSSEIAEPPFLAEEISLLNSLAEMLRSFLQRRQAIEALRHTRDELENSIRERTEELARTNKELRAERDTLQMIMDNTHTHLAYLDSEFNFLRVNSAYVLGCGHSRDELLGRNHFDLFPDAKNQAIFERVRDTGQPIAFRAKPFQYLDQPERGVTYWDWTLTPVLDEDRRTQGLVFSLMDVTEREDLLARLRLATTAAGLGVFEWDVAVDRVSWENERMYEIFGRQREEGAMTKAEFVAQILDPDDVAGFERDLVEGMQPDRFFISTCRIHRGNDSAWRYIEFLGRFTLAPDGRPLRLVGTVTDITDRRQALESLSESEARLAFALDVSQMGHWELDLLNHTTRRSQRHDQIFGYDELLPSWTYEMFLEHVVAQDRERVDEAFKMAVEQGRDWDLECRITRSTGALRWIWVCGRLHHDESGHPSRLVGIVLDITARKQAEEERERLLEENSNHREFLEQLMQALPVGIAVVGGPDYRFEFVNPYFEAAAGLALPEVSNVAMVGRAYADALPHMATRSITSLLDQARRMGKTASVHEFGVTMAPGREETYWNVDHVPLRDGGRADRILILVSEVTAQVRARKQIEQLMLELEQERGRL
jgi:PAS domain S-box-containing protein